MLDLKIKILVNCIKATLHKLMPCLWLSHNQIQVLQFVLNLLN